MAQRMSSSHPRYPPPRARTDSVSYRPSSFSSALHLRRHALQYGVAAFTITVAIVSAKILGFFSPLLVYLPFFVFGVPLILCHGLFVKAPRGIAFWCAAGWCLYMILTPRYPSSSHLNSSNPPPLLPTNATYFVAANLYNSAGILPSWTRELLSLVENLGPQNVFISIYESNSVDSTKDALQAFKTQLTTSGVRHKIVMENNDKRGRWAMNGHRRVAYLADARNMLLEPMKAEGLDGRRFSRVLFFNDVYFDWRSVLSLLATNNGNYDLACAFDFDGVGLYDTWVTRDVCGARTKEIWPYFSPPESIQQLRRSQPVEVASCWNGISVFDAEWFLPQSSSRRAPLKFRDNTGCAASECFLSSFDMHKASSPQRPRIFMNPEVNVAYDPYSFLFHTKVTHLSISWPWNFFYDNVGHPLFGWLVDRIWLQRQIESESPECAAHWGMGWVKGEKCAPR